MPDLTLDAPQPPPLLQALCLPGDEGERKGHNGGMSALLECLRRNGFDVQTRNHAAAIFSVDFPDALEVLVTAILKINLSAEELIRGGGGEAKSTQRLRHALSDAGWPKHNFIIRKIVDEEEREATSHEIDHIHRSANGVIALEIEWNNKDPFFDRDLNNFRLLFDLRGSEPLLLAIQTSAYEGKITTIAQELELLA